MKLQGVQPSCKIFSERMCLWLEDESELYTLEELQMKMLEYSGNNDVYSTKRIKQKLIERYNNYVFFAEVEEKTLYVLKIWLIGSSAINGTKRGN